MTRVLRTSFWAIFVAGVLVKPKMELPETERSNKAFNRKYREKRRRQKQGDGDGETVLESLQVGRHEVDYKHIDVPNPVSLLLQLNDALSNTEKLQFAPRANMLQSQGATILRGNLTENLNDLTVRKILELQNYGCWCPKLVKEKKSDALCGQRVDIIDGYCHGWARCKQCLTLKPYFCDGLTGDYEYKLSFFQNAGVLSCDSLVGDTCAYLNCLCDAEMAVQIITDLDKMQDKYIGVDVDECIRNENPNSDGVDACCGEFPHPKAYNTLKHDCVNGALVLLQGFSGNAAQTSSTADRGEDSNAVASLDGDDSSGEHPAGDYNYNFIGDQTMAQILGF